MTPDEFPDCENAPFCMAQTAEIHRRQAEVEELLDAVIDCVAQGCTVENGELDSMALSTYRDALLLLARYGRVVIDQQVGRRVIAHWRVLDSQS